MSYKNILGITASSKGDAFCHIRDFICKRDGTYDYSTTGIGWTLFDSSYATSEDTPATGDWIVIYSSCENEKEDLYFKLTIAANYINPVGYQAWDSTTHAGALSYGSGAVWNITDSLTSIPVEIYGDLDHLFCGAYIPSQWNFMGFGKPTNALSGYIDTVATCSSAISGGVAVVTVDTVPSNWVVGREICVRTTHTDDNTTVKKELVEIEEIDGNDITLTLSNSYTAGARLSNPPCYYVQTSLSMLSTANVFLTSNGGTNGACTSVLLAVGIATPTPYESRYTLNKCGFQTTTYGLPVFSLPNLYMLSALTAPLVDSDTMTVMDGTVFKIHKVNNNRYLGFKVV